MHHHAFALCPRLPGSSIDRIDQGKSDGEDGKRCSAKGLKNIPAVYEKKVVRKEQSILDWLSFGCVFMFGNSHPFWNFWDSNVEPSFQPWRFAHGWLRLSCLKFFSQIRGKRQFPDRRQVITRVPRKLQRERSRSRGAGRDDAKDSKKGQKEQSDENQGKGKKEEKQKEEPEDEHTRYVKDMTRLVRLALELTETLMGKKCRDTALHFTLHADLLATEIYRGTGRKRPQILQEPLLAALNAVKSWICGSANTEEDQCGFTKSSCMLVLSNFTMQSFWAIRKIRTMTPGEKRDISISGWWSAPKDVALW